MHDFFVRVGKSEKRRLLLISGAPTLGELQRREPFVGDAERILKTLVLDQLGLSRNEIDLAWCDGSEEGAAKLAAHIEENEKAYVAVASLSQDVRFDNSEYVRGEQRFAFNLPELQLVTKANTQHFSELQRKLSTLSAKLARDKELTPYVMSIVKAGDTPTGFTVSLIKANEPKRIVYGVVLDPYTIDAQDDWIPPAEIEKTAHEFIKKSRFISYQHAGAALGAQVVESFIEPYPSKTDYLNALENKPHRAFSRPFGGDVVHSGAWVLGVELTPALWGEYEKGDLNAFSIEGLGFREATTDTEMPDVRFVEIEVKQ